MSIEALAVAALLGVGLMSLAAAFGRRREKALAQTLAVIVSLAGALTAWSLRGPPLTEADISFRPITDPNDGYRTSDVCRACHPEQYASWHDTYHRTMTRIAGPETVLGDFDDVTHELDGETYRLFREGDRFYVDRPVPPRAGMTTPQRVILPIVLVTGSHHMQVYWYPTGFKRVLGQMEFTYMLDEQRWVPRRAAFIQPPNREPGHETGRWGITCITCHSTQPQPWLDERDSRVGEFGISCEACHGPGDEHVRRNRDPRRRYRLHLDGEDDGEGDGTLLDDTMVDPGSLDHRRASEVCGNCHVKAFYPDDEIETFGTTGLSYRPGDVLGETRDVARPSVSLEPFRKVLELDPEILRRSFWPDGMVRVSGREFNGLVETPCYQRGEMSCMTCHVLHKTPDDTRSTDAWTDDLLKPGMRGDKPCLGCHEKYRDATAVEAHTYHPAGSSGSLCYNCHMPYTTYGLLKAERSHQVSSPTVDESLLRPEEGQEGRPNACNLCHLDRTLAWTGGHLETWYGLPTPELHADEKAVPASLIWMLRGDAGMRALMAWAYGWEDARQTSGWRWMPPFLSQLLVDPYDAVRLIASRSLRRFPGFEHVAYDPMGGYDARRAEARRLAAWWAEQPQPDGEVVNALALIEGGADPELFARLLSQRDNRPMALAE